MLLPEDRLEVLLDQLRGMPRRDRNAILRLLSPDERERLRLAPTQPREAAPSGYSADIETRISAIRTGRSSPDGMTAAGAAALARALELPDRKPSRGNGPTLAGALGDMLRPKAPR